MCGILGGTNRDWNYQAGIDALEHRGPDGKKIYSNSGVTMAFARLAIIDLTDNGMQPMTKGPVTIVYNGEIYGYKKLKRLLEKKYPFTSRTDTEVILNAYLEYGDAFVHHIDGIFAIAIYDRRNETIRLFRDRVGVKPLYYFYNGKHFAFSSEMKGICSLIGKENLNIDKTAIYDYFTYNYIPAPKTMYQEIKKLEPAQKVSFNIKSNNISKTAFYWRLEPCGREGRCRKKEDINGELRQLIHRSVKEQMAADVPVGTFLSGGMDSSVITYESALLNPSIETFSIGFESDKYDESKYFTEMINERNLHSNSSIFTKKIYRSLYPMMKSWYDEPFADTSAFPTYFVSKLAKEKVTVVLTGDGGDELFGGYAWYTSSYKPGKFRDSQTLSRMYDYLSGRFQKIRTPRLGDVFHETLWKFSDVHGYTTRIYKKDLAKKWGIPEDYDEFWLLRKHDHPELPLQTRLQYIDFKTYLPEILTKVDIASMQVSLEARVPFLAKNIVEYVFQLSQEERCPQGDMKHLLKQAYPEIPESIRRKEKQGFCIPQQYLGNRERTSAKILREVWRI